MSLPLRALAALFVLMSTSVLSNTAEDPFLWLETIDAPEALAWVEARNATTMERLKSDPRYAQLHAEALAILTSEDKIPYGTFRGGFVYNFWQDATHVRGLWRRTTPESYRSDNPQWTVLLDLDALSKAEGTEWTWSGASYLAPDYQRALVSLSPGGSDAVVIREFDLAARQWVPDGFALPLAKSRLTWVDRDTVWIAGDYGPESLTESGYPRSVREWKRGTDWREAKLLFEVPNTSISAFAFVAHTTEQTFRGVGEGIDFFHTRWLLRDEEGSHRALPVPHAHRFQGFFGEQVLFLLREDWQIAERTLPAGALVSFSVNQWLQSGTLPDVEVLHAPAERVAIESVDITRSAVVVSLLDNVRGRIKVFSRFAGQWRAVPLAFPDNATVGVLHADPLSDKGYVYVTRFLEPTTLFETNFASGEFHAVKQLPAAFDSSDMTVRQLEATSADGTRIPYFLVHRKGMQPDASTPVVIAAYGGFQVSYTPAYADLHGKLWIERGGAYAVANIRGGGEFGPQWHQAALRHNRQRAFDDLIAVGEDLARRKLSEPARMGIIGGSNGGLLVAAVMVQRPDLFGAVVCQVPLLDMLRYHELPPGASWISEYGDPRIPEDRAVIARYSPYQNLQPDAAYPPIFLVTSTRDDRVHPGHARKFAARMEAMGHPFFYFERTVGGHAADTSPPERAERAALQYTYFFQTLADD